ncbi:predicted protein [Histoplasma capsulatum var. duboisii H88]|uniref:Predicted protein n=1 Tax=Ajellomyces capsulatus (strain H88) TaxID=544711 RepID=F0UE06_AJEC8|nr:predicted protein [Histoplasma capsulatum var. duboisii H88]
MQIDGRLESRQWIYDTFWRVKKVVDSILRPEMLSLAEITPLLAQWRILVVFNISQILIP